MSETDTGNTGTGGTGTDTSTEDAAAERLVARWLSQEDGADTAGTGSEARDLSSLPEWAQKQIRDLRKEAGDHRTGKNAAETKHQEMLDSIAKALGLKGDEKPEPDRLAQQLNELQEQFGASQRRTQVLELAAEYEIPKDYQHLLTATDHDTLVEQARGVGELVKAKNEAAGTPAFQPNPGQGQGGGTATLSEQLAAAEAEGDRDKVAQLKTQRLMELRNTT